MNTRNSTRGLGNSSLNSGSGPNSSSSSRNNTSVEIQDTRSRNKSRVMHSPVLRPTGQEQRSASTSNLSSNPLLPDIQMMENQDSRNSIPLSGRASVSGSNPNINLPVDTLNRPTENVAVVHNENLASTSLGSLMGNNNAPIATNQSLSSLDSLMALMEQTMRTTREEFRRELDTIRDSISQIGSANGSYRQNEFLSNVSNSNTPSGNSDQNTNLYASCGSNGNIIKLEKWKISFDGSGSVSEFLFKVETLSARTKCSSDHLLSNFHVLLNGKAEQWYWRYTKQTSIITYPLLRHALTKEFGHIETDHEVILKISSRKQLLKESYDDYHTSIVSMNLRLQSPLPDSTLIDIIKRNLNPNLRFLLFNAQARDLNELRDTARKAEKVLRESKFQNPNISQPRDVHEIDMSADEPENYEPSDPQIEAINISKRSSKYDYSNIQCWNCLAYGHSYIYCHKVIDKPFCFKCGVKGVLTPNCPKKHNFQENRKLGDMANGDNRPSQQSPISN